MSFTQSLSVVSQKSNLLMKISYFVLGKLFALCRQVELYVECKYYIRDVNS